MSGVGNAASWSNAPDWILVARDGSNPTMWNSSLITSSQGSGSVLGRYAYNIYNEGGLLDANAAGYPAALAALSPSPAVYKNSPALADLKQLPAIAALSPEWQNNLIDGLTGWRNYASASSPLPVLQGSFPSYQWAASNATNYYNTFISNPAGFLNTVNRSVVNGQTDRMFSSRQQLINLLAQGISPAGSSNAAVRANIQNSLQYLGTFSRSLDQPTYSPDPSRPTVIGPAYDGASATYSGGNSAVANDGSHLEDLINPAFQKIRLLNAGANATRNDGTPLRTGEPLLKKRFALNRLAWLTYKGPSRNLPPSDPAMVQYLANGIPQWLLDEGTDDNIYSYFGLKWTPGPGDGGIGGVWTYTHGIANTIGTLDVVAAANREADFFEILKAAVSVGSLAKDVLGLNQPAIPAVQTAYLYKKNSRIDNHVLQIGANIMNQAAPDNFPGTLSSMMASGTVPSGASAICRTFMVLPRSAYWFASPIRCRCPRGPAGISPRRIRPLRSPCWIPVLRSAYRCQCFGTLTASSRTGRRRCHLPPCEFVVRVYGRFSVIPHRLSRYLLLRHTAILHQRISTNHPGQLPDDQGALVSGCL